MYYANKILIIVGLHYLIECNQLFQKAQTHYSTCTCVTFIQNIVSSEPVRDAYYTSIGVDSRLLSLEHTML